MVPPAACTPACTSLPESTPEGQIPATNEAAALQGLAGLANTLAAMTPETRQALIALLQSMGGSGK
jgi:hypothetical protein